MHLPRVIFFLMSLVPACGGSTVLLTGNADSSAPCVHDSDCGANQLCAYKATEGCQAVGHCVGAPAPGLNCNVYEPACACDGTDVGIACGALPDGYANKPVAHLGVCTDGGLADGSAEGGPCGSATCAAGDVCVQTTTSGGPCRQPDDAGACPAGTQLSGGCCVSSSTSYACQPLPSACGGIPSCGCASSVCTGCQCQGVSGADLVDCLCLAP